MTIPTQFDGWRKILLDQLDSKLTTRTRRSIGINFPPVLYSVISRAARARGMSMSAFIRRAAISFAVFDLGLDWAETIKDEPGAREFGYGLADAVVRAPGEGYGVWQIDGLHR